MTIPLITIGITSHNAADTLGRAVDSATNQSWAQTEIVIVDDASSDNTLEILDKLQKKHPSLRVFRQKTNQGVAAVRNIIIQEAQGEFLAFFDDDDESAANRLEMQYNRIIHYEERFADGGAVICHAARMQIHPNGGKHYEPTMGTNDGPVPYGERVAERMLTGRPQLHIFGSTATCSQMARLAVYKNLGGFDPDFRRSEDTDFNIRAALSGAHFAGIAAPLVTQTMTLASDKKLEDEKHYALQLLEKHKDFINKTNSYEFCRRWTDAKYDFLQKHKIKFMFKILALMIMQPIFTARRLFSAMPNIGFNLRLSRMHHE